MGYNIGDFGIARTIEKTMSGLSKKGTYSYMAPEVYRGAEYGYTVDIYSLGIVLYRLLNRNRIPFMPDAPAPIRYTDREKSLSRRMNGEPIKPPFHQSGRLSEIVLKACAYNSKDRYNSPTRNQRSTSSAKKKPSACLAMPQPTPSQNQNQNQNRNQPQSQNQLHHNQFDRQYTTQPKRQLQRKHKKNQRRKLL